MPAFCQEHGPKHRGQHRHVHAFHGGDARDGLVVCYADQKPHDKAYRCQADKAHYEHRNVEIPKPEDVHRHCAAYNRCRETE